MRVIFFKIIVLNFLIILTVVLCYSEGFLCLRPWDESLLRAGMSIFIGIASAFSFLYGNYRLLGGGNQHKLENFGQEMKNIEQARNVLRSFHGGWMFGKTADTAADQLLRLQRTMERADRAIGMKFDAGTMAYDRYVSTIQAAREAAMENCIGMANRMQLFDESEYLKLKNFKMDGIPDEIQKKQIALYQQNVDQIESAVAANEKLILALDTMSLELTGAKDSPEESAQATALLDEITKLTEQVKLYT